MLTVALLAMFTGVANPEILRMVSIESSGARLGHPRGMCVEARMTLALSPGSAKTERSPVEHRVGYTTRITSSHLRIGGDLPLAACRRCHNLSTCRHHLGTLGQRNAVGISRLLGSLSVM